MVGRVLREPPDSLLPFEAVVDPWEGDEPLVDRVVVRGIGAPHRECAIEIDRRTEVMVVPDSGVDSDRCLQHDRGPESLTSGFRGDHPEAGGHEGSYCAASHVSLGDHCDARVAERPRPHGDIDAPVSVEELEGYADGAHTAQDHSEAHAVGVRRLRLGGGGECDDRRHSDAGGERCGEEKEEAESVHESRNMGRVTRRVYALRALVALLVGAAVACTPPDEPPTLSRALAVAVVDLVRPDTVRTIRVGPGVVYRYLWSAEGPWAIHIVEAALSTRCDLVLDVLRPEVREAGRAGFETVTSMVGRSVPPILAAVNADFFTPEGRTVGSEVVEGVVVSARSRPAIGWRWNEAPWIGSANVSGDILEVGWPVPREGGDGRTEAVGGFPILLSEGVPREELGISAATRHPRTAVGYSTETGRLWLVVVDGRQPSRSTGMTLVELTALLGALGADEALNLDGGGSSVMVLRDHAVSTPSDETGERSVVNALVLRREPAACAVSARRSLPSRD